jgi:hypothetical protein
MDKVMKAEIEKVIDLALTTYCADCGYVSEPEIIAKATSSLTSLIIKWLEGKMVEIDILGDEDAKWKSGRNQLITELIGELQQPTEH